MLFCDLIAGGNADVGNWSRRLVGCEIRELSEKFLLLPLDLIVRATSSDFFCKVFGWNCPIIVGDVILEERVCEI